MPRLVASYKKSQRDFYESYRIKPDNFVPKHKWRKRLEGLKPVVPADVGSVVCNQDDVIARTFTFEGGKAKRLEIKVVRKAKGFQTPLLQKKEDPYFVICRLELNILSLLEKTQKW